MHQKLVPDPFLIDKNVKKTWKQRENKNVKIKIELNFYFNTTFWNARDGKG